MKELNDYLQSWDQFREYCENKVKGICTLSNKNWRKLREWHMDNYLKSLDNPYGFIFKLKWRHPGVYKSIHCLPKFYHYYRMERQKAFASVGRQMVVFPTWRGFYGSNKNN